METKLLTERIDALNANLEKIIGLMGVWLESKAAESKRSRERFEEQIRRIEERSEEKKAHDTESEKRTPFDIGFDIGAGVKDILGTISSVIVDNAEDIKKILGVIVPELKKAMDLDSDSEGEEWKKGY